MRVISYGGGVQSTALIAMAATGELAADVALFANVGDDSEKSATLAYVRDVMVPWAREQGFDLRIVHRLRRDGSVAPTLLQQLESAKSRSIEIPARMANGAPGTRNCTETYKIRTINRWLRDNGVKPSNKATVLIGFSYDEAHRMGRNKPRRYSVADYPLVDRRITREDCKRIIERAGLPVPPKSSCWFCPYQKPSEWARLRRDDAATFERAAQLEAVLIARRAGLGKDPIYLTRFAKPLAEAIQVEQDGLDFGSGPGAESCDEGYCWT